jgi:glutamate-1-semialdehyde 2,1-aminomutase
MIAGLTTLELIAVPGFHRHVLAQTESLMSGLGLAAAQSGIAVSTNHVCGMFGLFFTREKQVDRFDKVMACDTELFKRFFHGMLAEGIYLAPSPFEAGFMSAAHSNADIDATVAAAERVFASLKPAAA